MQRRNSLFLRAILAIGLLFSALSPVAFSQLISGTGSVLLSATLAETLTVSATPNAVTFNLVSGGTATGSSPVAITTTWALSGTRTSVTLFGYFASATSALSSGFPISYIPTSAVYGQVTTGSPTTFTPFIQTGSLGGTGAGLPLFIQPIVPSNVSTSRTDNLTLQIQLFSLTQLPAGTYTGTLTLQAVAI
jgi:hypothetical protein